MKLTVRVHPIRTAAVSLLAAAVSVTSLLVGQSPASAGSTIPSLPRTNAADNTPRVVDDAVDSEAGVNELRQVGTTMYAGGDFNTVQNAARTASYTRTNIFSFNADTGAVSTWAPAVNGAVLAMEPSADGRYLYIGGNFTRFAGVAVNRVVKYDLQLNRVDPAWRSPVTATRVSDLQLVGGRLFVAGIFAGGMVALDPTTGARTNYLDPVAATGAETGYNTRVYRFSVNPAGDRMAIIGSFTAIGGQPRQQAALIQLGATSAAVSPWSSARWNEDCIGSLQWYTRDVDWSPDGSYFAIVTTGAGFPGTQRLCDTITRWNPVEAPNQQPAWINYSGGDTFHSVVVTNLGVIASGHFRWLDNPLGRDSKGPGAVDRMGIGAVDPTTGRALSWNPGKSIEGGLGGFDLYFTGRGLWVAHFEQRLGTPRELHEGLGLLPF